LNISLTPKLEGFVQAKVKTGDHNNASEVIREALRVLPERETGRKVQVGSLRKLLREGEDSGVREVWTPRISRARHGPGLASPAS